MKNLVVAQSGGPTAVINATLVGIIEYAMKSSKVDRILGAKNGIEGILEENFVDLKSIFLKEEERKRLSLTPSSYLGSCRRKMKENEESMIKRIIEILRKNEIGYFVYIGGNDSMDTVYQLSNYCKQHKITEIQVVGAPKTIDNDLVHTDHCPGFGSAAKYVATTFAELERDCSVYQAKAVTIVEVMGRNTGWLTGAAALARLGDGNGPDLIYLCEKYFSLSSFLEDVKEKLKEKNAVLIAVSEGIQDEDGYYISEKIQNGQMDEFGHSYISGVSNILAEEVRKQIGCKVRAIELSLMQRCSGHLVSKTDLVESKMLGEKACECVLECQNGMMASVIRKKDEPYEVIYTAVPVEEVANYEKKVPEHFIHQNGHDVTEAMIRYLFPLIQGECNIEYENGIPKHSVL